MKFNKFLILIQVYIIVSIKTKTIKFWPAKKLWLFWGVPDLELFNQLKFPIHSYYCSGLNKNIRVNVIG
jgi:hypothetical protein